MNRGAWRATVHRVTKNQTRLKRPRKHARTPSQGGGQAHTSCTLALVAAPYWGAPLAEWEAL